MTTPTSVMVMTMTVMAAMKMTLRMTMTVTIIVTMVVTVTVTRTMRYLVIESLRWDADTTEQPFISFLTLLRPESCLSAAGL